MNRAKKRNDEPEVVLGQEDEQGQSPHSEDGSEVAGIEHEETAHPPRRFAEQVGPLDQDRGEEDGEGQLGDLTGLEVERADVNPEAGAVDVLAQMGEQGEQQQADTEEGEGVPEPFEVASPPDQRQGGHERSDPGGRPHRLEAGFVGGEAGNEDIADPVEQPGRRQQDRIGVRRQPAHGQVGGQEQAEDDHQERPHVGGQVAGLAQTGEGVETPGEDHDQEYQAELGPPTSRSAGHVVGGTDLWAGTVVVAAGGAGGRSAAWACCFSVTNDDT